MSLGIGVELMMGDKSFQGKGTHTHRMIYECFNTKVFRMRNVFSNSNFISRAVVLLAFTVFVTTEASGQQKSVPPSRLTVDTVMVKKLGRLHGVVLDEDAKAVSIVVRRAWLEKSFPEFAKEHFATEEKTLAQDREKIKQRLESWRNEYDKDDRRVIDSFVDENLKLLGLDEPGENSRLPFTIVKLDPKLVRQTYRQGQDKHRLASIGWSENIEDVETISVTVLKKKIEKQVGDTKNYVLTLGDKIPIWLESDEDWEVRKSLMEFGLLSRVEFQGSGKLFLRRGLGFGADGAMREMMHGGALFMALPEFQNPINALNRNDKAWMKPMIEAAKQQKRRCFSVAKLTQGQTVNVEIRIYHQVAGNQWVPLAAFSNSESVAQQSPDDVNDIAQDPNVTSVIKMAIHLGAVDPSNFQTALKCGAATKKALSKSMGELDEFIKRYSFEIDYPPIEIPLMK